MFQSTKTYGHEVGLSVAFRQWKADSHCSKIHGYALSFTFTFEAKELDERNWVIDFGGLKSLKDQLALMFDHKLVVAVDDPHVDVYYQMSKAGIADVRISDSVGCEAFAQEAFILAEQWLYDKGHGLRVKIKSVEVREHGANSAIYTGK